MGDRQGSGVGWSSTRFGGGCLGNAVQSVCLRRGDALLRAVWPGDFEPLDLVSQAQAERDRQLGLRQVAVGGANGAGLRDSAGVEADGGAECCGIAALTDELDAQPMLTRRKVIAQQSRRAAGLRDHDV